jgi:sporulation protein YlmC with PRC-barrel domain
MTLLQKGVAVPQTAEQIQEWTKRDLIDVSGGKIGTIDDVHYDDLTGAPKWLLLKMGLFGTRKVFVPAARVRASGDELVVCFTKDRVKNAPRLDSDILSEAEEQQLYSYYGLDYEPEPPSIW